MDLQTLPKSLISKGRVLVVDDDEVVREMLLEILEFDGYEVVEAEDGSEALQILHNTEIDLVLTDLQMPNVDGLQLIQSIRKANSQVPVVVITGYPSLNKAIEVMKCGAVDFLPKPFEVDGVLHVVRRTLKERVLQLENRRLVEEVNKKAVIERLNGELHEKVAELTKMNVISERLGQVNELELLYEHIVQLVADLTESQRVSLMLYSRRRNTLSIRSARGLSSRLIRQIQVPLGEGVAGKVAQTRCPVRVNGKLGPEDMPHSPQRGRYSGGSYMCVPLSIQGDLLGVLNATDRRGRSDYGPDDERVLVGLAEKAASKIETLVLYEGLYLNFLETLQSLVTTIEAKDPYTHRHSQRVTDLAVAIAGRMELPREEIDVIRFATLLHDLGKIGVRDSVLTKTGKLTDKEFEQIKAHPVIGERIVDPLGLDTAEKDIIRHHHERLDGHGYPDGLKAEEISKLVRIVTVADSFDAMTSTRSYREALSIQQGLAELRRCAGSQFDPEIVEIMIGGVESGEIKISPLEERMLPFGED